MTFNLFGQALQQQAPAKQQPLQFTDKGFFNTEYGDFTKKNFATIEQSGDISGNWLHLRNSTFKDLQDRNLIRQDISFDEALNNPELYNEVAGGYMKDIQRVMGSDDVYDLALWSRSPANFRKTGGDIEKLDRKTKGDAGKSLYTVMKQRKKWLDKFYFEGNN